MPYVDNDGVKIYYETEGKGPPLMLHSGLSGTLENYRARAIEIKHAAKQVEDHYQASRYPEETSKYFCCLSMEIACQHYPDVLDDILRDIEIIFQWGEEQIQK